jgi:hypothetical protein
MRQKEIKERMGRGMSGRGITLKEFLPIPLPIIPLPKSLQKKVILTDYRAGHLAACGALGVEHTMIACA